MIYAHASLGEEELLSRYEEVRTENVRALLEKPLALDVTAERVLQQILRGGVPVYERWGE